MPVFYSMMGLAAVASLVPIAYDSPRSVVFSAVYVILSVASALAMFVYIFAYW